MSNHSPVPDATDDDAVDAEWKKELDEAWKAFHEGECDGSPEAD